MNDNVDEIDTIDCRFIYPQIMKRLGGEYAQCADVVYKVLSSIYFCLFKQTLLCYTSLLSPYLIRIK